MTNRKYGTVELADYLRMTGQAKPKLKVWKLVAVAGCLCLCSFMAGTYTISLERALSMLDHAPREEWERKLGVVMTFQHVETAIDVLAEVAKDPGQPGVEASIALGIVATKSLEKIKELASLGLHAEKQEKYLKHVSDLLSQPR